MQHEMNVLNQPVGLLVPHWIAPKFPPYQAMIGRFCRVEPINPNRDALDYMKPIVWILMVKCGRIYPMARLPVLSCIVVGYGCRC